MHRDKIDIKNWGSIKEYMQSLNDMEYIILIISENYLKSSNCMYEVLETIRDRKYRNKIPARHSFFCHESEEVSQVR